LRFLLDSLANPGASMRWRQLPPLALGAMLALAGAGAAQAAHDGDPDPWDLPLDELLEVKVFGASRYLQDTARAPASVTVITANEIRSYGHQTLSDVLNSVRGVFVDYDRHYSYVGVRGFERPGDYNARVLLLVDGFRLNDPVYDIAMVGTEFPVDLAQIERIEVIRGPGSSVYGSNAFFAVVNIVTRHGAAIGGAEAGMEYGSFGTYDTRVTLGNRSAGGFEWLLAANRYSSDGRDLYFAEFDTPETNNGYVANQDGDRAERYLAKFAYRGLAALAGHGRRVKDVPTASYGTAFNPPYYQTTDTEDFIDLSYTQHLGNGWMLIPRLYRGESHYYGDYPRDDGDGLVYFHDASDGRWWGTELRVDGLLGAHRVQAGAEYQRNTAVDQYSYDIEPYMPYTDIRLNSIRRSVFVQDEWAFRPRWLLSTGLRYDDYGMGGDALSPRLGLLWQARDTLDLKLLYGKAFRAANAYEQFYYNLDSGIPPPGPETTYGYEFITEYRPAANSRYTAALYYNKVRNLIGEQVDPVTEASSFANTGTADGRGIEFEYERAWAVDRRLRLSYALQQSTDRMTDAGLANSPEQMANLNYMMPLAGGALRLGTEVQYLGPRQTWAGAHVSDRALANLTLTTREWNGFELGGGVRNLFDRDNQDPSRTEHLQATLPLDERTWWLRLTYRYR
jgi:outer membrane receptor protein involved in Fe transport